MEENKEKQLVKYKFGADELDLNQYILNIEHNVDSYLLYQQEHNNWNDSEVSEFKNAYTTYINGLKDQYNTGSERFSTNSFGDILDNQGLLSDKDNDGIDPSGSELYYDNKGNVISTDDYNQLKDRKKKNYHTFSANRQVADYFRKVGKKLNPITSELSKKIKFNIPEHGFISYWQKENNPGGGPIDFTPYLEYDKADPVTHKRSLTNRANYLAQLLENYINLLLDYDYNDSEFSNKEEYINKLRNAIQNLRNNVWDNEDIISLNKAGIGGDFLNTFLTTEENPNLTEEQREQLKKEEEAKTEEEKRKTLEEAAKTYFNDMYKIYLNNNFLYDYTNPYNAGIMGSDFLNESGEFDPTKFYQTLDIPEGGSMRTIIDQYLQNPYSQDANQMWLYLIGKNLAKPITGNSQFEGYYYIPQVSDKTSNSVLAYNPLTGSLIRTFIGDVPELWKSMVDSYNLDHGIVDLWDRYKYPFIHKNGGTIEKHQLGGNIDIEGIYNKDLKDHFTKNAKKNDLNSAYQSNRTPELLKTGERQMFQDPNMLNTNNGFEKQDMIKISASAADIAAMLAAFAPGYGTAASAGLGLYSTLATGLSDVMEDGLDWGDAKNFAANLGMDVLGLIPGGGAVSKGTKIVKNLKNLAPKIMGVIGAAGMAHTLANSGAILDSYQKLLSEPSKLTVDDWRNISAGLGVITGGVLYGKAKYETNKINKKLNENKVAVEMIDNEGNKLVVAFDGDDAKAIRKALESGNIEDIKKATVDKYENFKDWKLSTSSSMPHLQSPWDSNKKSWFKLRKFWTTGEGNPKIYDLSSHRDKFIPLGNQKEQTFINKGLISPSEKVSEYYSLNSKNDKRKLELTADIDAKILAEEKKLMDPIIQGNLKLKTDIELKKKELESLKKLIEDAEKISGGVSVKDLMNKKNLLESEHKFFGKGKRKDYETFKKRSQRIENIKVKIGSLETELKTLQNIPSKTNSINKRITKIQLDLAKQNTLLTTETGLLESFKTKYSDWNTWEKRLEANKEYDNIGELNSRIKSGKNLEEHLRPEVARLLQMLDDFNNHKLHSKEYNNLLKKTKVIDGKNMLEIASPSKLRKNIQYDLNDLLKKYNIEYKNGGSLNLKLVRSFGGGGITNTSSTANWYLDMFNSPEMLKWLETFNKDNYQDFNNLLNSWSTNLKATGYKPGTTPLLYNLGVYDRLGLWNKTNTNPVINLLLLNGTITTKGNSGDNAEANYQDGYFGEQEFLRHGGTRESWLGREEELKTFLDKLTSRGLTYTLNNDTGMYELGLIPLSNSLMSPGTNPSINHALNENDILSEEDRNPKVNSFKLRFSNMFNLDDPTLKYALPRVAYLNMLNKKMVDLAIAAEHPFLQDPIEKQRKVLGSYSDLVGGVNNKAQLNNLANKSATSDANTNNALNLEASLKGLDYENAGKIKDDEMKEKTSELALLQSFENLQKRHDAAMQNRLALLLTEKNKSQIALAGKAKNVDNINTLLKEREFEFKKKLLERKRYLDLYTKQDIHDSIMNNLKDYVELSDEEFSAWNDVISGKISASDILNDPKRASFYMSAYRKADLEEKDLYRLYLGVPESKWSYVRNITIPEDNNEGIVMKEYKKGSKIELARIKARIEDNKQFHKTTSEEHKRINKLLDNISKSLYGYIKSMIVK